MQSAVCCTVRSCSVLTADCRTHVCVVCSELQVMAELSEDKEMETKFAVTCILLSAAVYKDALR